MEESDEEDSSEYEADPPDLDSRKVDAPPFSTRLHYP